MNNNWKRSFLLVAAAVTATVATASAQDVTLRATVPFRFSVSAESNLPAGNYLVTHQGNFWLFRGEDSNYAAAIGNAVPKEEHRDQLPSLTFVCVRSRCQIQTIHSGYGTPGAEIPAPKLSKSDAEELAYVTVPMELRHK